VRRLQSEGDFSMKCRSPDEAKRNPGLAGFASRPAAPDFASFHPGYNWKGIHR
jgi:hypothetical protein